MNKMLMHSERCAQETNQTIISKAIINVKEDHFGKKKKVAYCMSDIKCYLCVNA